MSGLATWAAAVVALTLWPERLASAETVFPLRVSANGRYLEDQRGAPFLYTADTAWLLFYVPLLGEVEDYLENRRRKGFNAVQAQLLAWQEKATNCAGQGPLRDRQDLATPNEAFFARVDQIVQMTLDKGFLLNIAPAWLGCCEDGWRDILQRNGPEKCRAFGRFLGRRYAKFPNLMWTLGGDRDPDGFRAVVNALAEGLKETAPHHLLSAHAGSPHSAREAYPTETWLDVNSTYTYAPNVTSVGRPQFHVYAASLADWRRSPPRPFILLESAYENERHSRPQWIRRQAYWSVLCGSTGQAMGNRPIYLFGPGWRQAMESSAARDVSHWKRLFDGVPWHQLVPDAAHALVVAGFGTFDGAAGKDARHARGFDYVTAALAPDGSWGLAYLPVSRPVTVDLGRLRGRVRARWFDPTSGEVIEVVGSPFPNADPRPFTPPARNRDGDEDFVLVLEAPASEPRATRAK